LAAKIGILGESTSVSVNVTTTLYTVPADKAARIRVLWVVEGGAGTWRMNLFIGSPGTEITYHEQYASGDDAFSGTLPQSTPDPPLSTLASLAGMQELTGLTLTNVGDTVAWLITPFPVDYYLSTGDTVKVQVADTAAVDFLIQVQGVEDDA